MSKFERIVPDKWCANFLPTLERDGNHVLALLAEREHLEDFRSPVRRTTGLVNRTVGLQLGREHAMQDDEFLRLERALREVYCSQSEPSSDSAEVTQDVMRHIRQLTSSKSIVWMQSAVLDQLVWRTAVIAAAVVMIGTILSMDTFRTTAGESGVLLADEFESPPLLGE